MTTDRRSRQSSISTTTNQPPKHNQLSPFKCVLEILTHYDTPKVVRFESKWVAILSLIIKLSLAVHCIYLMCQQSTYQVFERSPISAAIIKVKQSSRCYLNSPVIRHFPNYNCTQSTFDVNDFIIPPTENSAITIATRMTEIEHILRLCDNTSTEKTSLPAAALHQCHHRSRCILPPYQRRKYENWTNVDNHQLCWFKLPAKPDKRNYQVLDYVLFVKHFVEFPQLHFVRNNLIRDIHTADYFETCEYDRIHHPLCPKFRISKILQMIEKNPREYEQMFYHGSLIEIKIGWKCNLDRNRDLCQPHYEFVRLDIHPYLENPYVPGSNFMTSRHFFKPNERELHRVHTRVYNLRIIVSVTGEVGKFDLFQMTTSIGSFLGIFGTGAIVCDLIAAFFTNLKSVKYDT